MGLETYRKKRDFTRTREPRGRKAQRARDGGRFVVQKHAARRLHYDFRLELDGVLKSWAVPKGPSLDPAERRLAVHVEDHPLEYGDFEGVIPAGEYGAGPVLIWDRGRWIPEGDPAAGYRGGKLAFRLEGQRLRGSWALVKMRGEAAEDGRENWLLIKQEDQSARPAASDGVVDRYEKSVASGRTLEQVERARDRIWNSEGEVEAERTPAPLDPSHLPGARKGVLPDRPAPQLATLVEHPPAGDEWIHEIKLDGYRVMCRVKGGRARMITRGGHDWTQRFPTLAATAAALPVEQALLDGEVVAMGAGGLTNFQALQNSLGSRGGDRDLSYFVFDLLHLDGYDLTRTPLIRRKGELAKLLETAGSEADRLRYTAHVQGHAETTFREACRLGVEGLVSKRVDRPYRATRSRDWLKSKCLEEREFVVGGYVEPTGGRVGFGSLLLGAYDQAGDLIYTGRVGTGFTEQSLRDLHGRLESIERESSPFANPPSRRDARRVHWVEPRLVVEVAYTERTEDGILRHPSYRGMRPEASAKDIALDGRAPAPPPRPGSPGASQGAVEIAGVRLTHPDRVLYPRQKVTKRRLAAFYADIAQWILPHLEDRPLTLVRCPEGYDRECFFQKHANESVPDVVTRVRIKEEKGSGLYMAANSLPALISLVQLGVLELHTWGSRTDRLDRPDRMIFDLDPGPSVEWTDVIEAAHGVRDRLTALGLASFVKTTGGKGLHVVVPLVRRHGWDAVKDFAKAIAEDLAREAPDRFTAKMAKKLRAGKVFIDYLRNGRGATAVAAYSTRARPGATVSVPVDWNELRPGLRSEAFTVDTVARRLAGLRRDPWAEFADSRQSITAAMQKDLGLK